MLFRSGYPTVITSWFGATFIALVVPLGDLHPVIATEYNVVLFLTLFSYLNNSLCKHKFYPMSIQCNRHNRLDL